MIFFFCVIVRINAEILLEVLTLPPNTDARQVDSLLLGTNLKALVQFDGFGVYGTNNIGMICANSSSLFMFYFECFISQ